MKIIHFALAAFSLSVCGAVYSAPTTSQTAQAPRYFGADANVAVSKPDAILRYADHERGFAELRLPEGEDPAPLAVIFHGGCWSAGIATQDYMAPLATRWQQQGIATLNVDYREVGDGGGWPDSFEDWQNAAALIDQVAKDHPIDRDRVTLVGHSAGAMPALWLPSTQSKDGPIDGKKVVKARAAIIFDGPADIALEHEAFDDLCGFAATAPFMGGSRGGVPERYAALSPSNSEQGIAEVLFMQAVLPPPPATAQAAIGADVTVFTNDDATHFDVITPGSKAYEKRADAIHTVLTARSVTTP